MSDKPNRAAPLVAWHIREILLRQSEELDRSSPLQKLVRLIFRVMIRDWYALDRLLLVLAESEVTVVEARETLDLLGEAKMLLDEMAAKHGLDEPAFLRPLHTRFEIVERELSRCMNQMIEQSGRSLQIVEDSS